MTNMTPAMEQNLRIGFKYFNHFMLALWRLGLGRWLNAWPEVGGRILVLTQTGRKSGKPRRTPVNYAIVDGEIYVTAGFGAGSDWYKNLQADPAVEVWLPDGWWSGVAEDVSGRKDRLYLLRQVLIASGAAARFAGIEPHHASNEELAQLMETYRLVRIRRTAPRTGPGGPGDLAWVWPLAVLVLLAFYPRRRR